MLLRGTGALRSFFRTSSPARQGFGPWSSCRTRLLMSPSKAGKRRFRVRHHWNKSGWV